MSVRHEGRSRSRKTMAVLARICWVAFVVLLITDLSLDLPGSSLWVLPAAVPAVALDLLNGRAARGEHTALGRPPAIEVAPPVTGRWTALNSPADKVPSHGTHGFGQTYAIDIVAEGQGEGEGDGAGKRPGFSWLWPLVRPSSAFPAHGRPLLAVADATVVHASDGQRDHLSRTSLPMVVYLMVLEGFFRSLGGPSRVTGNHLVLDLGGGTYALYAHVRRGSLAVRAGDRVRTGQRLAECGNSGNSSEPHVHFQLMDGPDLDTARGLPFSWHGIGVPSNGKTFTVPTAPPVTGPVTEPCDQDV
ncbi:M23 family metallopeptidase [Streptomyces sp. NPDC051018]|uniref:M23 family metallopeptidase n=1 Tax=Streptomyces sp. NPDC051018 TaxID=3365639 RepID=UPI00379941C0